MQPNHNFGGSEVLLEVSLMLETRPEQYCQCFIKTANIRPNHVLHKFDPVSRGHTGICMHCLLRKIRKVKIVC